MQALKQKILEEGQNLGRGILKIDSFLNHQVDPAFMKAIGEALAERFRAYGVTKVITAEISGITPAVMTGLALGVPVVYARKSRPITMIAEPYRETAPSHTKGRVVELMVSPEYLQPGDRVLLIDDFLATGQTIAALVRIVQRSGATLVGIGAVIEKAFEGGRDQLKHLGVPIEALAVITRMENGLIEFAE
ncbi:MAG: xanthine phosphoribosyltransferase [Anaerolineae bacterium]